MISKSILQISLFACACLCGASSFAAPAAVSAPLGSEENQYQYIWKNREEIFSLCLRPETNCQLTVTEKDSLTKMLAVAKAWKPFQFYLGDQFLAYAKNMVRTPRVVFLAFTPLPGLVIFEQSSLYEKANRFTYDRKLFLLALVAAQQAGLSAEQADSAIKKTVLYWQPRWVKMDLNSENEPEVQVWMQLDPVTKLSLFDNVASYDLMAPMIAHLPCANHAIQSVILGPAIWGPHAKTSAAMFATLNGNIKVVCETGETFPLSYGLDLVFQAGPLGWAFLPNQLKVHITSVQ